MNKYKQPTKLFSATTKIIFILLLLYSMTGWITWLMLEEASR